MTDLEPIEKTWQIAKVCAFWDQGLLTHERWLERIDRGNQITIKQSVLHMRCRDFVRLVGVERFKARYLEWRAISKEDAEISRVRIGTLDIFWSSLVCGYPGVKVEHWHEFTPKQQETWIHAIKYSGDSIYGLAKRMQRNYRRTYDDVMVLHAKGMVHLKERKVNGRICHAVIAT